MLLILLKLVIVFIYMYICMYITMYIYFFFPSFLGLHPRHMEIPRLGVELELQLLAYITATPDPSASAT